MQWKEHVKNNYPHIMISDCLVDEIQLVNQDIILKFSTYGIIISNKEKSNSYRTKEAQIVLENCDISNISIKYIRRQRKITGVKNVVQDLEFNTFINNISKGVWKLEMVEEYYSVIGGMYIARIFSKRERFWCYIQINFKDISYYWNEIDYSQSIEADILKE